jgi:hypothetical protein
MHSLPDELTTEGQLMPTTARLGDQQAGPLTLTEAAVVLCGLFALVGAQLVLS